MATSVFKRRLQLPIVIGLAILALALAPSCAIACILLPEHQEFTETDLESAREGFRPGSFTSTSDPSTLPPSPLDQPEGEEHPWDFLKASRANEGGASSSSSGSIPSLTLVSCIPGTTVAIPDYLTFGELPEVRRLCIPDQRLNDLLRPPRVLGC